MKRHFLSSVRLSSLLVIGSMAVIIAGSGCVFTIILFWQLPQIEEQIQSDQIRLTNLITSQLNAEFSGIGAAVYSVGATLAYGALSDQKHLSACLDALVQSNPEVGVAYLADRQGRVLAAGERQYKGAMQQAIGTDLSVQPLWLEVPTGHELYWSDEFISPMSAKKSAAVFYRQDSYTLIAELNLDHLVRRLEGLAQGGVYVYILDHQNKLIVTGVNQIFPLPDFQEKVREIDESKHGVHFVQGAFDQEAMVGVLSELPVFDWKVAVFQYRDEVNQSRHILILAMLATLLMTLLIAFAESMLQASAFRKQFRRLTDFAEKIKQGEYSVQWKKSWLTEFNEFAAAVESIGEAIQSREVTIAESLTAYREMLENTTELAVKLSNRGRIIYANAAFCSLLGVPLEKLVNQPLTNYLREGDESGWRVAAELGAGASSISFECFMISASGQAYRVAWTAHAGLGDNVRKAYAAIGRDISEEWYASEALRQSEERLRTMLDNATTVAIQWYDMEGRIVYWGPGAERLYGHPAAEAVGRTIAELNMGADLEIRFKGVCERIMREGGAYGPEQITALHSSGRTLDILMTVFVMPAEEEKDTYFVCMDIDMTEQVKQAAARREAERWFATVFHSSPVAMAVWARQELVDANAAWERLFDMSVEEGRLETRGGVPWNIWDDEPVEEGADDLHYNIQMEGFAAWIRSRSGVRRLCHISDRQVNINGTTMLITAYKDITAEHEASEKLRELNETLEQRVAERTEALHCANNELSAALDHLNTTQTELIRSEKMAALGSLVAGVAHELSTPLGNSLLAANTIRDYSRALRKEMEAGLRRSSLERYLLEVQDGNEIIERNLSRAAELVASFKQVAVDQTSSQQRKFLLTEVVEEITMTLRPSLKRLPYIITVDIAEGLLLDSFPGPLGQVLTNLINNAIIHGFDGRDDGVIKIVGRADGSGHVILEVCDDGAGISEANLLRLFDPFFTTRFGQQGSGLGLPIVHSLVTNVLGGSVEVESVLGQGTLVRVRIPRVAPVRIAEIT